jgi:hypothetical protein
LVPVSPNELSPARRGAASSHGPNAGFTRTGPLKSISGLGDSKCAVGYRTPRRTLSSTLTSPASPAALSRWPMLPLIEPIAQCGVVTPASRKAWRSASTSTTSPSGVAEPWHSTYPTPAASTPASRQAAVITSVWACRLGALMLAIR